MISQILREFSPIQGAEATVDLFEWYGEPAIRKIRIPKAYRIDQLDKILRSKRTKEEVEILYATKIAGVKCPKVLFADPQTSEIIMEYIQGDLLKDYPESETGFFHLLGKYAGLLHSAGIIHGDLTTKNVIITGEELYLIDFGLSFFSDRLEDRAEDLHLLKQVLKSSDTTVRAASRFESSLKGYADVVGGKTALLVRKQIGKIELRGRYAQVD